MPALVAYLARIPEHRQARGTQHPLVALLRLVCVAELWRIPHALPLAAD